MSSHADQAIPVALGLAGVGAVLIASGITGNSLADVFQGNFQRQVSAGSQNASGGPTNPASDTSVPTADSNAAISAMKNEANQLSGKYPYRWGGGHGSLGVPSGGGFDCSGSVCAVLGAAGLVKSPLTSGSLMSWGMPGPGKRVTVYANPAHTFMVIDGQFFGTGALGVSGGPRWGNKHTLAGFTARHPGGL